MRGRMPHRSAAVALVVAAAVVCAGPASAVQTSTYKLAATGGRTKIVHGYGSGAVHDTFVVADLTTTPVTLTLDVVGATLGANGDFALGPSGSGFAGKVHLPQRTLTLAPKQVRQLTVTIDRPRHTDEAVYAAITAMPVAAPSSGIGVQTRLALLVEVAPHAESTAVLSKTSVERLVAVLVAVALLAAGAVVWARRRRKAQPQ
jgi:hypothetical protein